MYEAVHLRSGAVCGSGGTSRFRPDPSRTALNETETKTGDPVERVEAELFTDGGNDAVVRLAGRKFPGVLIQGDTLSSLRADVAELVELCSAGDLEEPARGESPPSRPGVQAPALRRRARCPRNLPTLLIRSSSQIGQQRSYR